MSESRSYDYLIIGGGMAGLQLVKAFMDEPFFDDKDIAIIEPNDKKTNDKSWSFWEKGKGKWESILYKSWDSAIFKAPNTIKHFNLSPYAYKMIRSIDFYDKIKKEIAARSKIQWIQDSILKIEEDHPIVCLGKVGTYSAKNVFDSRVNNDYIKSNAPYVLQHFIGQFIKSKTAVFDKTSFTMMDFNDGNPGQTSFMYVLPFDSKRALVEYTFFNSELAAERVYLNAIDNYLKINFKLTDYKIEGTESGVIPMSSNDFTGSNTRNYLKIGTAGGWVKASSGYSFKNTENKIRQVIDNIKSNRPLGDQLTKRRFQFYDRILLTVLQNENHLGAKIFNEMYNRNEIQKIFTFLDEESKLTEEIRLILKFSPAPFLRALRKNIF